jgi:hypothetical protein
MVSPRKLQTEVDGIVPDNLYDEFLNYIRGNYPNRTQTPLMLIINEPEQALDICRKLPGYNGQSAMNLELTQEFLTTYFPTFIQNYRQWTAQAKMITLFSVGKIIRKMDPDTGLEEMLISHPPNFIHSARIMKFIYETFTGVPVRYSWVKRLLRRIGLSS